MSTPAPLTPLTLEQTLPRSVPLAVWKHRLLAAVVTRPRAGLLTLILILTHRILKVARNGQGVPFRALILTAQIWILNAPVTLVVAIGVTLFRPPILLANKTTIPDPVRSLPTWSIVPVNFRLTVALLRTTFGRILPKRPNKIARLAANGYRAKSLVVNMIKLTPLPGWLPTKVDVILPDVLRWPGPKLRVTTSAETLTVSMTLTFLAEEPR